MPTSFIEYSLSTIFLFGFFLLGDLFPVNDYSILAKKLFKFYKNKKPLKNKSKKAKKYLNRFDPIINSKKYLELLSIK